STPGPFPDRTCQEETAVSPHQPDTDRSDSEPDLHAMLNSGDPAQVITALCMEVGAGIPAEQALEVAGRAELARGAPAQTGQALVALIGRVTANEALSGPADAVGRVVLLIAALVVRHAHALDDLGRCRESLGLYDALMPLFTRHAPPGQADSFRVLRAIVL